ncbi:MULTISPECIES: arginine--tRNA ligase [unclassified Streptomyces]|uniref:arginine--tRNA ligase n=1 Tax=unclassified Streptomyces TaxID=2593676 RepID=UPI0022B63517|nr:MULTISPECIES: arginine--tRNA ligase [unclassified Streptomyces]MCZ7416524.1 DALR anticodon-binding domain-containing protein [Streptomyces sp. WMMC897]MCZ7433665.1 DALR anticodon-binding domain-containing protein [Streptomyces sp. WMMC1477]
MTPAQLSRTVRHAWCRAVADGALPARGALPDRVTLRRPPHGDADYASNLALRLAPGTGRSAADVAAVLRERLAAEPGIARVEVAGPGFLNITVRDGHADVLAELLARPRPSGPPEDPACDARRWAELTGAPVTHERRAANPLFRVQYAHSRARALRAGAHALGFGAEPGPAPGAPEAALGALLADADRVTATGDGEALARHLLRVADAFLDVLYGPRAVLPPGDEKPGAAHRAQLALAEAAGTVLAGGLTQLGISAPDHL